MFIWLPKPGDMFYIKNDPKRDIYTIIGINKEYEVKNEIIYDVILNYNGSKGIAYSSQFHSRHYVIIKDPNKIMKEIL